MSQIILDELQTRIALFTQLRFYGQTVAALCRQENLHQNIYCTLLKEFMEAGKARLLGEETRGASRADVSKIQQENEALRQAVADLTVEVRALKKSLY